MINFFKNIGLSIVSFLMMLLLISILIGTINFIGSLSKKNTTEKKKVKRSVEKEVEKLATHYHYWNDNKTRRYSGKISVKHKDVRSSTFNKKNINTISWSYFYKKIIEYDKLKINTVYELFDQIYRRKNLSRKDFADVIVTFVQNIPYNILTMDSCNEAYFKNESIKEMIDDGTDCDGNVFGGLYTPTEFISNFKGDCDTRTVFLYTVLNRYGYDTKILNSEVYGHSIIGVNLPSRGRFKTHLGKRYYTWETTSANWKLGDLPPSTSRMYNWNVAL